MTLPNRLTLTRLILTPIYAIFYFLPALFYALDRPFNATISLVCCAIILVFSEITDFLDGFIARKTKQITDLGKLMDPFADVFSRLTFFACFVVPFAPGLPSFMLMPFFLVILWRETIIMFVRMILARYGVVLAAKTGGKIKAVLYSLSILYAFGALFGSATGYFSPEIKEMTWFVSQILFFLAVLATLISLIQYLILFFKSEAFLALKKSW